jgi:hypothetical protein
MTLTKPYSIGAYNKSGDEEQWIRITEGCPHGHEYCYEPKTIKIFGIPEIIHNSVKIMDMNLLCKPEALHIIKELGTKKVDGKVVKYELVCGIDYRFLTQEIAMALRESRFEHIRLAWDWAYADQVRVKTAILKLLKAGYKSKDLMIFMICNWKIPLKECCAKLNICKYWNVKVADCYFDGQVMPNVAPIFWTLDEIKMFRREVRKHNQITNFGIDPELRKSTSVQTKIKEVVEEFK